jgi:hypothetical protein
MFKKIMSWLRYRYAKFFYNLEKHEADIAYACGTPMSIYSINKNKLAEEKVLRQKAIQEKFIHFSEVRDRLSYIINGLKKDNVFPQENNDVSIIDSFFNPHVSTRLPEKADYVGFYSIPMVAVIGAKTGMIYYFGLYALLPELKSQGY